MTLELDVTEGEVPARAQFVKCFGFHHAEHVPVSRWKPRP